MALSERYLKTHDQQWQNTIAGLPPNNTASETTCENRRLLALMNSLFGERAWHRTCTVNRCCPLVTSLKVTLKAI